MRQLRLWHKIGFGILGFLVFSWLGLVYIPTWWWIFPLVPFGGIVIFYGSRHGFKFWKTKKAFETKYVKTMSSDQAERKILEYCDKEDIIIQKASPKEGNFSTVRVAGMRDTPFLIWKRKISLSKLKECWALLICDMTTGTISVRSLDSAEFTLDDLDAELEKMGGAKKYIERVAMPEQRGPVIERIYEKPKEEGEE